MDKLLKYLRRYWPKTIEKVTSIVSDGIEGDFKEKYVVGQYVLIKNSIVNDGVFKITGFTTSKITLDGTFSPEEDDLIMVIGLAIPRDVIRLETEIRAYKGKEGLSSESIDDYSVGFKDGSGWQNAFKSELNQYRLMYEDLSVFLGKYRWQDRMC
jgi:hypothetical protein